MPGAAHYLPLFLRTAEMLENRRDQETGYTTFLTGPSSNLVPGFGGGPNGSWSYRSGVSVTYTAALDRMAENVTMLDPQSPLLPVLANRRALILAGIDTHLLTSGPESQGALYFVRSKGPASGVLHGKINQSVHGYFEASPNHDAVFHRVVNDSVASGIMATMEMLGAKLRPNTFVLPNTDAGGGVGYDDMLCGPLPGAGTGATCGGLFSYGVWVNGGVWTTQEGRMIMAYYRTGRPEAARASYERMLSGFANDWRMDAPLADFGASTSQNGDTMITADAFAPSSAFIRGLFEYVYKARSLTLVPHLPGNITSLDQRFAIRWGPYRLFVSSSGVPSSGIAAVLINGTAAAAPHTVSPAAVVLSFGAMPPPSATAAAAVDSDVSTASDPISVEIRFKEQRAVRQPATAPPPMPHAAAAAAATAASASAAGRVGVLPQDYALRFVASDLATRAGLKPGANVSSWRGTSWAGSSEVAVFANASARPGWSTPTLASEPGVNGGGARISVQFDGRGNTLVGEAPLSPAATIIAAMRDQGSDHMFSSVLSLQPDLRALAVSATGCASGLPSGPHACNASNARVVAIDYGGSGNYGFRNISWELVVASVSYGPTLGASTVGGCSESDQGVATAPNGSTSFQLGSRGDGYGRDFKGRVYEVIVYNRTLSSAELSAATAALEQSYGIQPTNCSYVPPPKLDCTALASTLNAGLPSAAQVARVNAFVGALRAKGPALTATLPYAMASMAQDYVAGFERRCTGMTRGQSNLKQQHCPLVPLGCLFEIPPPHTHTHAYIVA